MQFDRLFLPCLYFICNWADKHLAKTNGMFELLEEMHPLHEFLFLNQKIVSTDLKRTGTRI